MPEGHAIHRLARRHQQLFAHETVRLTSPQGRFTEGAALLDGRTFTGADAWGKHLFHAYDGDLWLHVHLGLYGKFRDGPLPAPEPRGALRLALASDTTWLELRGPTRCEVVTRPERTAILDRLGPDPIRRGASSEDVLVRILRSRAAIGTLLMDQTVVSGIGNIYRAEILFRHGIHPFLPGRALDAQLWPTLWADLITLMRAGVRAGRIVTTEPADRERPHGRARRVDSFYVYGRAGHPCRVCGTAVLRDVMAARTVFWCPTCQPDDGSDTRASLLHAGRTLLTFEAR